MAQGRDSGRFTGGGDVASFFGLLGLKVDRGAWQRGQQQIDAMRTALTGLAAYASSRVLTNALIGFNSNAEQGVLQLKAMLALARKTDIADQAREAERMYASLQKRAAALPGTLDEYIGMAGKITRVAVDAGLSIQELEDLTVNAVVAAKGLGEQWEVAARDIEQAIMGRFNTTDPFSSKVLGALGYKGEEGRARYKGKSEKERAKEYVKALGAKQFVQLGEESGRTLQGRVDQFWESVKQGAGRIGKPVFESFKGLLEKVSTWIEKNRKEIDEFADSIGSALKSAFESLGSTIVSTYEFLTSGTNKAKVALSALAALGISMLLPVIKRIGLAFRGAFGPWTLILTGIVFGLQKLAERLGFDSVLDMFAAAWTKIEGPVMAVLERIASGISTAIDKLISFIEKLNEAGKKIGESDWFEDFVDQISLGVIPAARKGAGDNEAEIQRREFESIEPREVREARLKRLGYGPMTPTVPGAGAGASNVNSNNTTNNVTVNVKSTDPVKAGQEAGKQVAQELALKRGIKR